MKNRKNYFVFDVESTSLHGEAFAVGAILTDSYGFVIEKFELLSTDTAKFANDWVKENVLPSLKDMPTCKTSKELKDAFYAFYLKHKDGSEIWADCAYPVETNFLEEIYMLNRSEREWTMPYPLKDISSIVDINVDRFEKYKEIGGIPRKHHPVDDCICSLYCLIDQTNP